MQHTPEQHETLRREVVETFFNALNTIGFYDFFTCLETPCTITDHSSNKILWNTDDIMRHFARVNDYMRRNKIVVQSKFIKMEQFDESFVQHQEDALYLWTEVEPAIQLAKARFVFWLRYNGDAWHINHMLSYFTEINFSKEAKLPSVPRATACYTPRRSRSDMESVL